MEAEGVVSPVIDANIQFKQPIRYGEEAYVETWLVSYNGIRTTYGYRILTENREVAVTGETQHVIVQKESFRPLSLKKKFPKWHEAYENAKGIDK